MGRRNEEIPTPVITDKEKIADTLARNLLVRRYISDKHQNPNHRFGIGEDMYSEEVKEALAEMILNSVVWEHHAMAKFKGGTAGFIDGILDFFLKTPEYKEAKKAAEERKMEYEHLQSLSKMAYSESDRLDNSLRHLSRY